MTECGQRIGDEVFRLICGQAERDDQWHEATTMQWIALDLRDARAEIARLRAELATAKREAWIAGRDAVVQLVLQPQEPDDKFSSVVGDKWDWDGDLLAAIKALQPPKDQPHD